MKSALTRNSHALVDDDPDLQAVADQFRPTAAAAPA
jgi:hypothetical protein